MAFLAVVILNLDLSFPSPPENAGWKAGKAGLVGVLEEEIHCRDDRTSSSLINSEEPDEGFMDDRRGCLQGQGRGRERGRGR